MVECREIQVRRKRAKMRQTWSDSERRDERRDERWVEREGEMREMRYG